MLRLVVDDLRTFPFAAVYARTSTEGVGFLEQYHANNEPIDELWLDHDLGDDDTINPVVDWLCERCVWDDRPDIGRVYAHTSNPAGGAMIERTLRRWFTVQRIDAALAGAVVAERGEL